MRVVGWNIRQGGGTRGREIVAALNVLAADMIVLTEYKGRSSGVIREGLRESGYGEMRACNASDRDQILIASRLPFVSKSPSAAPLPAIGAWLEVEVPSQALTIAGIYVPVKARGKLAEKRLFWKGVLEAAERRRREPFMMIGDWNTGDFPLDKESPGRAFSCTGEYRQMADHGFVEAWRHLNANAREFSWVSNRGNGFRIDHCFVSPPLVPRLQAARYSHSERERGVSDHSPLVIDILSAAR